MFGEKGREGEREGEKHQCVIASHMPLTGDLAHNPGMCPDWVSNWWPCSSRASTQYTEPHQPGLLYSSLNVFFLFILLFVLYSVYFKWLSVGGGNLYVYRLNAYICFSYYAFSELCYLGKGYSPSLYQPSLTLPSLKQLWSFWTCM